MKPFFIDTANIDYIKNLWNNHLKGKIDKSLVLGITSNPNAFHKLNKHSLKEWLQEIPKLCNLIHYIREDYMGHIHIQCPSSTMSGEEIIKFATLVNNQSNHKASIVLKLPPTAEALRVTGKLNMLSNITGLADCSTALKCLCENPNLYKSSFIMYVSIIPGRMEQIGINAKEQVAFAVQGLRSHQRIITGSMRTIEGLKWVWQYKTIPTIGQTVWDLIINENRLDELLNIDYNIEIEKRMLSPIVTQDNIDLSTAFFKQMDECGAQAHNDFINNYEWLQL